MPTEPMDDQELIRALRTAVDDGTADLHYDRPLPEVRAPRRSGPAMVLAAAASVAAVAAGGALLASGGAGTTSVAGPSSSPASRWVANDDSALGGAITDPERLRTVVPHRAPSAGTPDICLLPAGDATSCGDSVRPPYPLLIETDAEVPASAQPFPRFEGYEGEVLEGWVGQDPAYGGLVWLRYDDVTIRISAAYYETGRELAEYLLEHPVEP